MFDKTMVRGLLAVALAGTVFGGTAMADVILPTQEQLSALGATQYQIAFVTSDTMDGTNGSESTYNTLAATDAAKDPTLNNLGASWTAITTTTTMDASVNAPTYSGVPIFNTQGQLILPDGSYLYTFYGTNPLNHPINYDESGSTPAFTWGPSGVPIHLPMRR